MSETVHYVGTATKVGEITNKKTISFAKKIIKERELDENIKPDTNVFEFLTDRFYMEFFFYNENNCFYQVEHTEKENWDDEIISASYKNENVVKFELRYYNGGAGFEECLEQAFDKLSKIPTKLELEQEANELFNVYVDEELFSNHTNKDIWIKGYICAKMENHGK